VGRVVDALLLGPQRRARAMRKRLEALDRADARMRAAGLDPFDEWLRSRDPRSDTSVRRAEQRRSRIPLLVLVLVLVGSVAVYLGRQGSRRGDPQARPPGTHVLRPGNVPPPSTEERNRPLGVPAPAPPGTGGYRFERTRTGSAAPVTWDPCRPIHYVVSGRAPAGLEDLVPSVLAELTKLTGFRFVFDGPTTEQASGADRAAYRPDRDGKRWAPVLVAWTDPHSVPVLAKEVIGLGGATAVSLGAADATYVSGIVYFDRPQFLSDARRAAPDTARRGLRAVVLHEFGHLLGLAHVGDPKSIMYPETRLQVTDFSAGDRRGLRALSSGPCVPTL
jgi:Matrixin